MTKDLQSKIVYSRYRARPCRGRVPFGYKRNPDNPKEMVPDDEELEYLFEGLSYLDKGYSYRSVSEWISNKTGRRISHQGICDIWKDYKRRDANKRLTKTA